MFAVVVAACAIAWTAYNACVVPYEENGWPYRRVGHEVRRRTEMPVIFFRAESHVLAFHVGAPLDTILEWENLEWWAGREFPVYFVMPEDCARDWYRNLAGVQLDEVLRTADHVRDDGGRSWVVMRSRGGGGQGQ